MSNSDHNRVAAGTVLWTVRLTKRFNQNGSQSRGYRSGFTLAEMLVAIAVLALVVVFVSRLVNAAAAITTLGHKHMDTDAQARQLLHRMAIDFNQMVKRSDVSYYVKTGSGITAQSGNDRIAFFSAIPGYYPQSGYKSNLALTAYRVNASSTSASYNKVERMGKGLHFNAGYANATPLLFLDSANNTTIQLIWPAAASATTVDSDYEVAGSQVFRLEYYYLLTTGAFSAGPWTNPSLPAIKDVAAIVVAIAAIDPKSKVLLTNSGPTAQLPTLAGKLLDYDATTMPNAGDLIRKWQDVLDNQKSPDPAITAMPLAAIQGVRLYERYFYLNQ